MVSPRKTRRGIDLMIGKIGFMQGRLSPIVDGKIQAFPWNTWRNEFELASKLKIQKMEWTLDQENLYDNPIMNNSGQKEILELSRKFSLQIPSLTGDCFMQKPFYKEGNDKEKLLIDLDNIIAACGVLKIEYVIFPLVDGGALENQFEENLFISEMVTRVGLLKKNNVKIVFESDYPPLKLKNFISKFPTEHFGINYDLGNSASLGFEPSSEIRAYGERILNVHIKDRVFGGTTVPLGEGDVNFEVVFKYLNKFNYNGNFILQTARSYEGYHAEYIEKFVHFVEERINKCN